MRDTMKLVDIQRKIVPQIKELLMKEPESISSVKESDKGWTIECEVLEKKSIPETYDLLKVFEFTLNTEAQITGFKMVKRMRRGDVKTD